MKAEDQEKPHPITKMGLVVNFDAGVVTGFTGITARLEEVNANSVSFKGTNINPSGAEWSVHGTIDRITGSLGAAVTWFNPKTNKLLMRMNYELTCKPIAVIRGEFVGMLKMRASLGVLAQVDQP